MANRRRARVFRARIKALAKGGNGVASVLSGQGQNSILVPGTLPGELVEIEQISKTKASLLRILEPSAHRIAPPCTYANSCGGCDWMHLDLAIQRRTRPILVHDELHRVGIPTPDIGSHHAEMNLAYRARARLAVVGTSHGIIVGFRASKSRRIVPVDTCLVLEPVLDIARAELASWLDGSEGMGEVTLMLGRNHLPAIYVTWKGTLNANVFASAQDNVEQRRWAGVSIWLDGATVPATMGDPRGVALGVDGHDLFIPPGGFMQAHNQMNPTLVGHVQSIAETLGHPILELFAGSGNFSIALARQTSDLETVEQQDAAVAAARSNLETRGLRARLRVDDAEKTIVRSAVRTVVLDPPRTGAKRAVQTIAASRARDVVMVSCDPATLARDSAILVHQGRFELHRIDVFEMFPHTSHVETVACFRRKR